MLMVWHLGGGVDNYGNSGGNYHNPNVQGPMGPQGSQNRDGMFQQRGYGHGKWFVRALLSTSTCLLVSCLHWLVASFHQFLFLLGNRGGRGGGRFDNGGRDGGSSSGGGYGQLGLVVKIFEKIRTAAMMAYMKISVWVSSLYNVFGSSIALIG